MTYVRINGTDYPASVSGWITDKTWDGRESKAVTMEATYEQAAALWHDDIAWSIVSEAAAEDGERALTEYDNSEYCILGDITVHRDGTCTIKMGKPTDLETAYEIMFGGVE